MCTKRAFECAGDVLKALRAIRKRHGWSGTTYYLCPECQRYHINGHNDREQSFKLRSGR